MQPCSFVVQETVQTVRQQNSNKQRGTSPLRLKPRIPLYILHLGKAIIRIRAATSSKHQWQQNIFLHVLYQMFILKSHRYYVFMTHEAFIKLAEVHQTLNILSSFLFYFFKKRGTKEKEKKEKRMKNYLFLSFPFLSVLDSLYHLLEKRAV